MLKNINYSYSFAFENPCSAIMLLFRDFFYILALITTKLIANVALVIRFLHFLDILF